jgi:hypothetical protein
LPSNRLENPPQKEPLLREQTNRANAMIFKAYVR